MRKALLGAAATTVAVALAVPAAAADDMMGGVSISGSMTQDIGFGNWQGGKEAAESIHFQTDAELQFKASGETDGGLMVSTQIELKGHGASSAVDENWLALSGGFGKITLGGNDSAANANGYGGIGGGYAGMGYYDGGDDYTPYKGAAYPIGYGDAAGVRYETPSIGGFQAGFSYQPDANDPDAGDTSGVNNDASRIALGANFATDFAGSSLTLAAAYIQNESGGDDSMSTDQHGIGASLGIGDTTLNLRYDSHGDDTTSYGVGVDHSMGALSFGIGVGSIVSEDEHMAMSGVPVDQTSMSVSAGGTYDMGGGLKISAAISQGSVENADGAGTDNDDVGVGLRIAFSF